MPDPIDELENFNPGAPMTPLPPSEVRRLGDRRRRRRTAGVALAAAAAVAIVATGGAVLAGGDEPRTLDPAAPSPTVTTTPDGPRIPDSPPTESPATEPPGGDSDDIPEGFPLAAGWPERHEPGPDNGLTGPAPDVQVLENLPACGPAALPDAASLDRLGAAWADAEDYRWRLLLTFEDADGAIDYQRQLVDAFRACPRIDDGEGSASLTDVRQTQVGGESWAVVRTFEYLDAPALGMEVVHIVRLGRALLVDFASTHGGGGPDFEGQEDAQIAEQTAETADVVSAMCAFTEAGC